MCYHLRFYEAFHFTPKSTSSFPTTIITLLYMFVCIKRLSFDSEEKGDGYEMMYLCVKANIAVQSV